MTQILTLADRQSSHKQFDQMFRARAAVFHHRLNWKVTLRGDWEIDRYDEDEDPVYLVTTTSTGDLTGSLRLLPTTGQIMLRNEFAGVFDEPIDVESPTAWECTRFCVHPTSCDVEQPRQIASELLIGLCELALNCGIDHIVGIYEAHMTRIYRRIGWSPSPLAVSNSQFGRLFAGIWDVSTAALDEMRGQRNQLIHDNSEKKAA